MPEQTRVGNKLRELREGMGLSVEALAGRSEISAKLIEQLEAGELVASLAPLIKIARGLGVHLGTFLDETAKAGPVVVRAG